MRLDNRPGRGLSCGGENRLGAGKSGSVSRNVTAVSHTYCPLDPFQRIDRSLNSGRWSRLLTESSQEGDPRAQLAGTGGPELFAEGWDLHDARARKGSDKFGLPVHEHLC